jgi:hypothetical protein
MRAVLWITRYLWLATRGHHFRPWHSPYLRWRIETYSGMKANEIGAREFLQFCWHERTELGLFLIWTARMQRWSRNKPVRELQ